VEEARKRVRISGKRVGRGERGERVGLWEASVERERRCWRRELSEEAARMDARGWGG
jgi:hypothetical protein